MIAEVEAFVTEVTGRPPGSFRLILRNGGEGPRDTAVAFALAANGEPLAIVKVAREAPARARLAQEHARLLQLARCLPPAFVASVPQAIALAERAGASLLAERPLPGRRLKDVPRSALAQGSALQGQVASWLAALALTEGPALRPDPDGSLRRGHVEQPLADYAAGFELGAEERVLLAAVPGLLTAACGKAMPLVPVHGDLCDANVLVHDGAISVVDWDEDSGLGPPGLDLFHFLASLAATAEGLGDPRAVLRSFVRAFLAVTPEARLHADVTARYLAAISVPVAAALPLFVLSWVRLALHKRDHLAVTGGHAAEHFPVTVFDARACLNVRETAARRRTFLGGALA